MDKPTALPVLLENIPESLCRLDRWVGWRCRWDGRRWKKAPCDCGTGRPASVADPATWSDFGGACLLLLTPPEPPPDGIGFVFTASDDLTGIDLDHCRHPETGALDDWAVAILRQLDTYAEVSPSRTGVKLIVRGSLPPGSRCRDGRVEMYGAGRYFTLTGHRVPGARSEVMERTQALRALHEQVFARPDGPAVPASAFPGADCTDDEVLAQLQRGWHREQFERLWGGDWQGYPSQSEADLALCGLLARQVGPDPERVTRLFGRLRLAQRQKWAEHEAYRVRTVEQAVAGLATYPGSGAGKTGPTLTRTTQDHSETSQDSSDLTGHTQASDSPAASCPTPARLQEAVARAEALAHGQEAAGADLDDFAASFVLARRLRTFGDQPEPFAEAVQAYCAKAGRPFEEFWLRLLDCWPRVLAPEGAGDWHWAVEQARARPLTLLPAKGDAVNLVASLAYYLSRRRPEFPLPVQKVGAVLGMSAQMGSLTIRLLVAHGVLALVKDYSYQQGRAKEFKFVGKLPTCAAREQPSRAAEATASAGLPPAGTPRSGAMPEGTRPGRQAPRRPKAKPRSPLPSLSDLW